MSFSAQVKIPLKEDPIIEIFSNLIEFSFNDQNEKILEKVLFKISGMILLLNGRKDALTENSILKFNEEQKSFGVFLAFQKFLYQQGFFNSNFSKNLKQVEIISTLCQGDPEKIWSLFSKSGGSKYSIEFQFGETPKMIQIMTAHASKGLEFPHVILGGIQNNGRSPNSLSYMGKIPESVKWKTSFDQKKAYHSPRLILENLLNKKKEFSESQRLFYVANTRAKKTLNYILFEHEDKAVSYPENSWVVGIKNWMNSSLKFQENFQEHIFKNRRPIKLDSEQKMNSIRKPFFHTDHLGLTIEKDEETSSLGLLAELSVTRLASLADCPRKFYLQNICKLTNEELEEWGISRTVEKSHIEESTPALSSSSERGTNIHEAISYGIEHNFVAPRYLIGTKDEQSVQWVLNIFTSEYKEANFISEKPIKFLFFNHMITGIPDLIIKNKESLEVWDFKTGSLKENNQSYWFQLKAYAYAMYELGEVDKNNQISLVLSFVDAKENLVIQTSYKEVSEELFKIWKLIESPLLKNEEHCSRCIYNQVCQLS